MRVLLEKEDDRVGFIPGVLVLEPRMAFWTWEDCGALSKDLILLRTGFMVWARVALSVVDLLGIELMVGLR